MARTRKITDQQILDAALEVFLEQGFGASTVDIAKRAGISEASIFKRFSTKENLFLKAMGLTGVPQWRSSLESLVGTGELKENLKLVGLQAIEYFQENMPKLIMLMSKGIISPREMFSSEDTPPIQNLRALTLFFETEIQLGRMKATEPRAVALQFIGSFISYVFLSQLSATLPEPKNYTERIVDVFWVGIRP
ncbi:MAG: TetR/AcrR family transcriptional regulator [Cyanobacteria bacterium J06627_32]